MCLVYTTTFNSTFRRYDMDGDGKINKHDLKAAFRGMKRDISDADVDEWILKRDSSGTGAVNFMDFVANYG
jgi:Ca2+-binding EF-hand superfamily protein